MFPIWWSYAVVERSIPLSEAEANWRCDAHARSKRVNALEPASTSGSRRSTPAMYDCLNGVQLNVSGPTSPANRDCCRVLS
jgi:hypothetical protein